MQPCRIELPRGVNFEVPRQYAAFCRGHPVRVAKLGHVEAGVLVMGGADTLSFTYGDTAVEWDLPAVVGLVINLEEEIAGMLACTLRVAFIAPGGETSTLPIFSANPSNVASFKEFVSRLRNCDMPVSICSSLQDLPLRATAGSIDRSL